MSESFVKTLKRDYARVTILPDADTILAKLPDWIEDYCEVHPHSGLKFRSPSGVHATERLTQPANLSGETGCTPLHNEKVLVATFINLRPKIEEAASALYDLGIRKPYADRRSR